MIPDASGKTATETGTETATETGGETGGGAGPGVGVGSKGSVDGSGPPGRGDRDDPPAYSGSAAGWSPDLVRRWELERDVLRWRFERGLDLWQAEHGGALSDGARALLWTEYERHSWETFDRFRNILTPRAAADTPLASMLAWGSWNSHVESTVDVAVRMATAEYGRQLVDDGAGQTFDDSYRQWRVVAKTEGRPGGGELSSGMRGQLELAYKRAASDAYERALSGYVSGGKSHERAGRDWAELHAALMDTVLARLSFESGRETALAEAYTRFGGAYIAFQSGDGVPLGADGRASERAAYISDVLAAYQRVYGDLAGGKTWSGDQFENAGRRWRQELDELSRDLPVGWRVGCRWASQPPPSDQSRSQEKVRGIPTFPFEF